VAEFDECNSASNASGVVTAGADGAGGGSSAAWRGSVPVDALAERLGVKRRRQGLTLVHFSAQPEPF